MKKLLLGALLLASAASFPGLSYGLDFIKFGTSHDVDFWGQPNYEFGIFPSTLQYLQDRGKNEIVSVDLTDTDVQNAFNGTFGLFDAIVVSESIAPISPASYALIRQYVSDGGCVIVTGSHAAGEAEFLNSTFGYNVSAATVQDVVDTFSIRPASAGTQFQGGPGTLVAVDLTTAYSNAPGTVIYSGSTGVTLFTDEFGGGTVSVIGWDYCCTEGASNTPQQVLDWYDVINRAFDECAGSSTPPVTESIPTLSEWGLMAMAGLLGIFGIFAALKRRKVEA